MITKDKIERLSKAVMSDGVKLGFNAAIDILREAKANTAPENQTWESAIAFLQIIYMSKLNDFIEDVNR